MDGQSALALLGGSVVASGVVAISLRHRLESSRHRRSWPWFGAVILVVTLSAACTEGTGPNTATPPTTFGGSPAPSPPQPTGGPSFPSPTGDQSRPGRTGSASNGQQATVNRIVDGDTLVLTALDTGGPLPAPGRNVEVRLLEIDAPEVAGRSECYGSRATDELRNLMPVGSTVSVHRDVDLKDQYDRYLLYVWNTEGTFVNLAMVRRGFAEAVLYQPNDRHWQSINGAQERARSAGIGLWGACAGQGSPGTETESTPATPSPPLPSPPTADSPTPPSPRVPSTPDPSIPSVPTTGAGDGYVAPPPPPDLDCSDVSAREFDVRPGDPHRFDADGDGIGCES